MSMNILTVAVLSTASFAFAQRVVADDEPACWNRANILFEAQELEETAHHFGEILLTIPEYAHLEAGAEELTEEASHFQEAVAGGSSCHHLQADFYEIYRAGSALYYDVLDTHNRYHNPHIVQDWNDMVAAYDRVRLEVDRTREHVESILEERKTLGLDKLILR